MASPAYGANGGGADEDAAFEKMDYASEGLVAPASTTATTSTAAAGGSPAEYQSYQESAPGSAAAGGGSASVREGKGEEFADEFNPADDATAAASSPPPSSSVYFPGRPYKGFSTSVSSSFLSPSTVRPDCCSMACFGVLQSDRTRFLLTGTPPPSPLRRVIIHVLVPGGLFLAAGMCAVHIREPNVNQFFSTMLVLVLIGYLVSACMRGTVKKVQVREDMLWRMREADALQVQSGWTDEEAAEALEEMGGIRSLSGVPPNLMAGDGEFHHGLDLGQTRSEMGCAHRLCGCYSSDLRARSIDSEPKPSDLCGCLWRAFAELCCHRMCNCFFQFLGCCALAQEAREIERLVPASKRRLDYVTFEPYVEYYGPIRSLRDRRNTSLWDHYGALSHLSLMLVKSLGIILFALFILSLIGSSPNFRLNNMAVLLATLAQAFLILYFVHWRWNRFDLSLDAVVKYFACGFILTTGLAVFFEMVETILLQLILGVIVLFSNLRVTNENEYQHYDDDADPVAEASSYGFFSSPLPAYAPVGGHGRYLGRYLGTSDDPSDDPYTNASGEDYMRSFAHSNPGVVVIYLLLNAYAMAALVEELCKYFGYKMVEHPDFLTDDDLADAAAAHISMEGSRDAEDGSEADASSRHSDDGSAAGALVAAGGGTGAGTGAGYAPPVVVPGQPVEGGKAAAPVAIVVAGRDVGGGAATNGSSPAAAASAEGGPKTSASVLRTLLSPFSGFGGARKDNGGVSSSSAAGAGLGAGAGAAEPLELGPGFGTNRRSLNSVGAGVTVAMVAVALGFACCENLIYIFVYNGSSVGMEISVLIARSLFPVHPLAAAIQSIGVCRRELERDRSHQLGKIISPAVLMHGSFDFVLMLISFVVALHGGDGGGGNSDVAVKAEIVSFVLSLSIVLAGAGYYVVESKLQKKRLEEMESREGAMGNSRVV